MLTNAKEYFILISGTHEGNFLIEKPKSTILAFYTYYYCMYSLYSLFIRARSSDRSPIIGLLYLYNANGSRMILIGNYCYLTSLVFLAYFFQ